MISFHKTQYECFDNHSLNNRKVLYLCDSIILIYDAQSDTNTVKPPPEF